MGSLYRSILTIGLLCCLHISAAHGWSRNVLLAQSGGLSQDQAVAQVREQTGGRVLDVKTGSQDGVTVYFVKVLLPDGRVRVVTVKSP